MLIEIDCFEILFFVNLLESFSLNRVKLTLIKKEKMAKTNKDQIEKTELFIDGLRKNFELVADKGITTQAIDEMETLSKKLAAQDEKVETMREELSKEVNEAREQLIDLRDKYRQTRQIVKLNFSQEKWEKFGLPDKR